MKKILALLLVLLLAVSACAMAETVKIGVFEPLSGDSGAGGKQEVLGMQYANYLQPTVEIGGVTYDVELVLADNGSSADKAPSAAQQLVSEGVSVVLGSYGSGVSIAASPYFEGAGIPAIGTESGIIGCVQQRHIPQLVSLLSRCVLHAGIQVMRRNLIGIQLVHQRHKLFQKSGTAGGIPKHPEAAAHLLQCHAHGEDLAAAVQSKVSKAAHLPQHTAGQIAQTQNLRVAAGCIAQSAAQLHFRFMGHMLRHNEKLIPQPPVLLYGFQHPSGFSGSGTADP